MTKYAQYSNQTCVSSCLAFGKMIHVINMFFLVTRRVQCAGALHAITQSYQCIIHTTQRVCGLGLKTIMNGPPGKTRHVGKTVSQAMGVPPG